MYEDSINQDPLRAGEQPVRIRRRSLPQRAFRAVWRFRYVFLLIFVLIAIGLAFELGRYSVYRENPGLSQSEQAAAILKRVGAFMQLPQNETPSMATITDAASAKIGQPFLADAMNGDVLIIYANAKEALLYRPSTNKIINVGPVDANAQTEKQAESTNAAPAQSISMSTPNGTTTQSTSTSKSK